MSKLFSWQIRNPRPEGASLNVRKIMELSWGAEEYRKQLCVMYVNQPLRYWPQWDAEEKEQHLTCCAVVSTIFWWRKPWHFAVCGDRAEDHSALQSGDQGQEEHVVTPGVLPTTWQASLILLTRPVPRTESDGRSHQKKPELDTHSPLWLLKYRSDGEVKTEVYTV